MSTPYASLAEKLDLLFKEISQPNGQRITYEYLERKVGIKSSTISRLRRGQNLDPLFTNIIAIANAFGVPVSYFATEMTLDEAKLFLVDPSNVQLLDELHARTQQAKHGHRNRMLAELALRASYMDDDGIAALADMAEYVLNRTGVVIPNELKSEVQGETEVTDPIRET